MPTSLAEASNNAQEDFDASVIDEFRKESTIMDMLVYDDAVNPAGGGATMTYGYRRLVTQPTASTRELNTEYVASNVQTEKHNVDLAVMGGAFTVDRVIARIGANASGAVALNLAQKIKATRTTFQDMVINGDVAVDAAGFDGLDKALTGSSTEMNAATVTNWSDLDTNAATKFTALDLLDEFLSLLDGTPTLLLGNTKLLAKIRGIVRRTGLYTRDPIEGLLGPNGRPITRENYGSVTFADPGNKAGSNEPIIPVETRNISGNQTNLTDLYAVRIGLDGFHGVTTVGSQMVATWLPDWSTPGAVKSGEVELGPVAVALKATKAAAVLRNIKVG
ncbi:major capsid protein [Micromonospora sp. RTGN7]|uniref:major capsid protein n=1 Tax=Micromonospora sp. RTGN7 TaxID=3016526 RepID=UPI0029FF2A6D|nr:phage major capsid protein [Micromonospora sp. RTGN7]